MVAILADETTLAADETIEVGYFKIKKTGILWFETNRTRNFALNSPVSLDAR